VVAAEMQVIADGGAYAYTSTKVLGNATLMCTGPYEIPNVKVDSYAVYTITSRGSFPRLWRSPGAFAAETQMNRLAQALGIDPVELRMRNVLREGFPALVGTPLPPGVTMPQVIEQCGRAAGWQETAQGWKRSSTPVPPASPWIKRGLGFACAFKNVGFSFGAPEQCRAIIELHGGWRSSGWWCGMQGQTWARDRTRSLLKWQPRRWVCRSKKVELVVSDTAVTGDSGSASASRMTSWRAMRSGGRRERRWRSGRPRNAGGGRIPVPPTQNHALRSPDREI